MRSSRHLPRFPLRRRIARQISGWLAGPAAAGAVLTLAVLAGHPVSGPVRWLISGLSLIPAVAIHCHQRDGTWPLPVSVAVSLAAAVVAYAAIVFGMTAGAAAAFAVAIAAQTGVLPLWRNCAASPGWS